MSDENTEQLKPEINPGLSLKMAREENGLSLEQVSQKLYVKADELAAIERNEINANKSITFTKGYVKSYAKLVGLDVDSVVADFDTFHNRPEDKAKLQSFSRRVENEATDDRWMMVTYIILLVIVGGVVWWWLQQPDSTIGNEPVVTPPAVGNAVAEDTSTSELNSLDAPIQNSSDDLTNQTSVTDFASDVIEPVIAVPAESKLEDDDVDITHSEDLNEVTEQTSLPENDLFQANVPEIPAVNSDSEVIVENIEAEEPQPVAIEALQSSSLIPVVFTFSQDCWVNIVDGSGEAIAYGVKKAGRVMEIEGVAPFTVTLGAPHVVNIVYDGETVDLSKFSGGQIAKFVLPVQG